MHKDYFWLGQQLNERIRLADIQTTSQFRVCYHSNAFPHQKNVWSYNAMVLLAPTRFLGRPINPKLRDELYVASKGWNHIFDWIVQPVNGYIAQNVIKKLER